MERVDPDEFVDGDGNADSAEDAAVVPMDDLQVNRDEDLPAEPDGEPHDQDGWPEDEGTEPVVDDAPEPAGSVMAKTSPWQPDTGEFVDGDGNEDSAEEVAVVPVDDLQLSRNEDLPAEPDGEPHNQDVWPEDEGTEPVVDDVPEPAGSVMARTSPWQPDTGEEPKPWERSISESGDDPDDDVAGGQPFSRMGGFAPQRGTAGDDGWSVPSRRGAKANDAWRHRTLVREVVETGLLAILVFLSVRASFQNFKVDGASMQPTLEDGQFLIVNKLIYSEIDLDKLGTFFPFISGGDNPRRNVFHGPERGDIVVLQDPRSPSTDLIKRIVGLPGETLEIVDGKVFVNDFLLEEPYITTEWNDSRPKIAIPADYYFVMGDNRENSLDSRSQQVGLIHKDLIIGKAMLSYWPRSKFGLAPNGSGKLTDEEKPTLTTQRIEELVAPGY